MTVWLPWGRSRAVLVAHVTCSLLHFFLSAVLVTSHETTDGPEGSGNQSQLVYNATSPPGNVSEVIVPDDALGSARVEIARASEDSDIPREYPTALVIASSVAAVSILVFFFLAYWWHTRQLDSRARKLAIRLAADAENGMRRRNCPTPPSRGYTRATSRPVSEASVDLNHYEALTMEEDHPPGSECGHSSRGVSESDAGDSEDVFTPAQHPGERGRTLIRGGRGGHRKWSRSRKHSSGPNMDKRDSAVTDKEILTHFASRRHSTFFI